jgi:uncharacterized membrane protein
MVGLGDLSGGSFESGAFAVSGDGSTVVGYGNDAEGRSAFIWDPANGMRSLRDVLTSEYGLDLTGWTLSTANDISLDGKTIVGSGWNVDHYEAWVATIPEPNSIALLALILCTVGRRRR